MKIAGPKYIITHAYMAWMSWELYNRKENSSQGPMNRAYSLE